MEKYYKITKLQNQKKTKAQFSIRKNNFSSPKFIQTTDALSEDYWGGGAFYKHISTLGKFTKAERGYRIKRNFISLQRSCCNRVVLSKITCSVLQNISSYKELKKQDLLTVPEHNLIHPFWKDLKLVACNLSGQAFRIKTYLNSTSEMDKVLY